jgi:hypothetical protein
MLSPTAAHPRPGRPVTSQHGSISFYNSGCRCSACRAGASLYRRERRRIFADTYLIA